MSGICLPLSWDDAGNLWMGLTSVVTIASYICMRTPTPPPNTWIGRLYRVVEFAALLTGRAKEAGIPVVDSVQDAVALVRKGSK